MRISPASASRCRGHRNPTHKPDLVQPSLAPYSWALAVMGWFQVLYISQDGSRCLFIPQSSSPFSLAEHGPYISTGYLLWYPSTRQGMPELQVHAPPFPS